MPSFAGYRCSICGSTYPPEDIFYTCPKDGGNLDVVLDYETIRADCHPEKCFGVEENSIWRYAPLLPVKYPEAARHTPLFAVGETPVYHLRRLGAQMGLENLWLKDESRNPTASFKDRASAVVVARAKEIGAETIITASTGNAGPALAGMAAAAGMDAVILAPKSAPPAKIAQLLVFGARVFLVDGTYDDAFDLTLEASRALGWYCRNTGYNPFTAEGKKTAAFEIWDWARRQKIARRLTLFVSVGDGNIISGIHKGFRDLQNLGWLERIGGMPRIIGVQAEGSAAIARAFHSRGEIVPVQAHTLADSISVDLPRDGYRALNAARQTGGTYLTVSDDDILSAIAALGRQGIFAEPAGAAAFAGLRQAARTGLLQADEPVLVINTGSGLKDIRAAMQSVSKAPVIAPDLKALQKAL